MRGLATYGYRASRLRNHILTSWLLAIIYLQGPTLLLSNQLWDHHVKGERTAQGTGISVAAIASWVIVMELNGEPFRSPFSR